MDSVSWLHWFESTHRSLGVLDGGHRFTDADIELVSAVLEGRAPQSELVLGTRWLHERALAMPTARELLAEIGGSGIAGWLAEDYTTWSVLLPKLSAISRGAFPLDELTVTHSEDASGEHCEIVCIVLGERHCARFGYAKFGRVDELIAEVNRWIAPSGRRFVRLDEGFACVTNATHERLTEL